MKKRLTILSLALAGVLLTGCSKGYNYVDGVMVTIDGQNYTVDDVFASFGLKTEGYSGTVEPLSSTTVSSYYNALNDVVVEANIKKDATMTSSVQSDIESFQKTVEDNAKTNGVSYNTELETELDSKGFDTLEEYEASLYLERKKTEASNNFKTDSMYTKTFIPGMKNYAPYHVRHILLKFDDASDKSLYKGKISEQDAKDIYTFVTTMARGEQNFGKVAQTLSEDSSSAEAFGDAGIMTTSTSFNSEFKYGVYTYDSFFNPALTAEEKQRVIDTTVYAVNTKAADNETKKDVVDAFSELSGSKAWGIPLSAVFAENYYAEMTKDSNGLAVTGAEDYNYPRNIIYNNYFNNHGLSFIYLDTEEEAVANSLDGLVLDNGTKVDTGYSSAYAAYAASSRFQTVEGISDKLMQRGADSKLSVRNSASAKEISGSHKILCDENGNPILVTRPQSGTDYSGLHFIVLQYDPFNSLIDSIDRGDTAAQASFSDYYTLTKPNSSMTEEELSKSKKSFVGYLSSNDSDFYTNRVSTLKSDVDAVYTNSAYNQFEYYLDAAENPTSESNSYVKSVSGESVPNTSVNENGIKVTVDSTIRSEVLNYIDQQKMSSEESTARAYAASWKSYLMMLARANEVQSRVLPVAKGIQAFLGGSTTLNAFNNERAK